jgi:hypothetical protein
VENYLRAQVADGCRFAGVGPLRHGHGSFDAPHFGGVGYALAVVAGGGGKQPAAQFGRGQMGGQVDPAAHFEGPHRLVILVLDPT